MILETPKLVNPLLFEYEYSIDSGGIMANFQTEGDWTCPKCGGVEFYKTRQEKTVTAARVVQYEDVRMCAKCDIAMGSKTVAAAQNSTSSCTSVIAALFFLSLFIWIIAVMFGL